MYSVTIIGGGAISCGYDNPNDTHVTTHTHGAILHSDISLKAIVEVDEKRQQYIANKWGESFKIFSNIQNCIQSYTSDIIIVATPTDTHFQIIKQVLYYYTPKLIICEKPFVSNLDEYEQLNLLLEKSNTKIITHFPRRFDPSINILQQKINQANEIYHFYGTFTKGLIHNGSHMIDLIHMFIGDLTHIQPIEKEICNKDIFGKFFITTDKASGIISNIDNDKLSLFELVIYSDIAKFAITGDKQNIVIHYTKNSEDFKDYISYSVQETLSKTLDKYGYNLFDSAINLIENDKEYNKIKTIQDNVNRFIFLAQKTFLES